MDWNEELPWRWAVEESEGGDEPVHLVIRHQQESEAWDDIHFAPSGKEDGYEYWLPREVARTLGRALIEAADLEAP